jgi:hypothetical protein
MPRHAQRSALYNPLARQVQADPATLTLLILIAATR